MAARDEPRQAGYFGWVQWQSSGVQEQRAYWIETWKWPPSSNSKPLQLSTPYFQVGSSVLDVLHGHLLVPYDAVIPRDSLVSDDLLSHLFSFVDSRRRYEDIIVPWQHESKKYHSQHNMRNDKPRNHERVVPEGVELGIGKAEDDGKHRSTDVAEKHRPEVGDAPVLAPADDCVQVAADLIALFVSTSTNIGKIRLTEYNDRYQYRLRKAFRPQKLGAGMTGVLDVRAATMEKTTNTPNPAPAPIPGLSVPWATVRPISWAPK